MYIVYKKSAKQLEDHCPSLTDGAYKSIKCQSEDTKSFVTTLDGVQRKNLETLIRMLIKSPQLDSEVDVRR